MTSPLGPWEPLVPTELSHLLRGATFPWWVAGGWAIDLHVGRRTRDHGDLDVLVLRDDLRGVGEALRGWDLHAADPPGTLRPWRHDEVLPVDVRDVWCRPDPRSPWAVQLMVDDAADGTWTYRSDPRITRPVASLDGNACHGDPPVLAPEVQLLHKSADPRAKDEADFTVALPHLGAGPRTWLAAALALTAPGHPWLARL